VANPVLQLDVKGVLVKNTSPFGRAFGKLCYSHR